MPTPRRIFLALAATVSLAACTADEPLTYPEMSFEQRFQFMNDVVLPEMRATFSEFDPAYASMTCATCHGSGAAEGTYTMPSADLPILPSEEEFPEYAMRPEISAWATFMVDDVWPQMADLLDMPMFDPAANPAGLSCANCHLGES